MLHRSYIQYSFLLIVNYYYYYHHPSSIIIIAFIIIIVIIIIIINNENSFRHRLRHRHNYYIIYTCYIYIYIYAQTICTSSLAFMLPQRILFLLLLPLSLYSSPIQTFCMNPIIRVCIYNKKERKIITKVSAVLHSKKKRKRKKRKQISIVFRTRTVFDFSKTAKSLGVQ